MGKERRTCERFETHNLVQVEVFAAEGTEAIDSGIGQLLNASQNGLLLETEFKIDTGMFVSLQVIINAEIVSIPTLAVRTFTSTFGKFCTGLAARNANIPTLMLLREYCRTRFPTTIGPSSTSVSFVTDEDTTS